MSAPASLLLAARTLVQFPRNPLLLGFSLAPVLMMFLVFGALFEGVTRLPGFPTDNYFEYLAPTAILLTTVPGPATPPSRWRPTSRAAMSTSC